MNDTAHASDCCRHRVSIANVGIYHLNRTQAIQIFKAPSRKVVDYSDVIPTLNEKGQEIGANETATSRNQYIRHFELLPPPDLSRTILVSAKSDPNRLPQEFRLECPSVNKVPAPLMRAPR
jgi:hypothetical protein